MDVVGFFIGLLNFLFGGVVFVWVLRHDDLFTVWEFAFVNLGCVSMFLGLFILMVVFGVV